MITQEEWIIEYIERVHHYSQIYSIEEAQQIAMNELVK